MNKLVIILVLVALLVVGYFSASSPIPTFTQEQMNQICIEEGI